MELRARRRRRLHVITLSKAPLGLTLSEQTQRLLADALVAAGFDWLPWFKQLQQ